MNGSQIIFIVQYVLIFIVVAGYYFILYDNRRRRAAEAETSCRELAKRIIWIEALIHYPGCWDTAAYPTVEDALTEIIGGECPTCHLKMEMELRP